MEHPLKVLIDHLSISRAELGRQLGVTRAHMSDVIAGKSGLHRKRVDTLYDLHGDVLSELGISYREIVRGELDDAQAS
jgi:transcriptional regulator with XRE-family HTH domain